MTLIGLLGFGIAAGGCTNTAPPPVDTTAAPQPLPAAPADAAYPPPATSSPAANADTATVQHHERAHRQQPATAGVDRSRAPTGDVGNSPPPDGYGNYPPPPPGYGDTSSQSEIIVETAPPPVRFERIVPRPGYVWTPGYWRWDNNDRHHVWVGGSYVSARPGFDWAPGRWDQDPHRGWRFRAGYWVPLGQGAPPRFPPGGSTSPHGDGDINMPPPPPRHETPVQRPGFVWTPGYWQRNGNRYAWVAGSYVSARPGFMWTPGRWERGPDGGWRFDQGHWVPRDAGPPDNGPGGKIGNGPNFVAPPAPRIEPVVARPGQVWTPGYWQWDGSRYAWVGGAYVSARPGFVWVRHRWVQGPRGGWHLEQGHWRQQQG